MLLNRGYLNNSHLRWLCSVLLLLHGTHQPIQADMFEGDDCEMKNMMGKCALGSKCTTFRDGIKQKIFTLADKVHCGFTVYEELICCPNSSPQVSERVTTEFWEDLIRSSTSTTTTTPRPLVIANTVLDASSPFFDFSKHLSKINNSQNKQKLNTPTLMGNSFFNQMPRRNANTPDTMENPFLNKISRPNTNIPNTLENPFFNQNSRSRPNEMMFNTNERSGNYKLGAGGNPIWSIGGGNKPWSNQNMGPGNGMQPFSASSTTVKTVSTRGNGERPAIAACRIIDEGLEVALTPHIIGGTVVELGEYPHMAAIGYRQIGDSSGPYDFRCGGSLIDKRFVLTAAHCVAIRDPQASIVRMGVTNFTDPEQMRNVVDVPIRNVHIHPNYRGNQVYNDIAILELETVVVYSNSIYPTCLYVNPEDLPTNSVVYVTGWGTVDIETRQSSNVLLKARLEMIGVDSCNESYTSPISRRQPFGVLRTQLCAYTQNKDACQGDSGGPLNLVVDESTKKYRLVGVISAGFSCGIEKPGLYTRVASYLDYIESIVWPKAATNPTEFAFS